MKIKLLVSALEPSSNLHLETLLTKIYDKVELYGIYDSNLAKKFNLNPPMFDIKEFSVMGFSDVFKKIPFFINANKQISNLANNVDKVLLMDASSFNIPLAKKIKKQNKSSKIYYYILPQIWAWKKWRHKVLEKYCDKLLAILPFEVNLYRAKAEFVGHPLLDLIDSSVTKTSLNKEISNIVFMPGSRKGEIKRIFPIFKEVAQNLKDVNKILVIPKHYKNENLNEIYGDISEFNISFDTNEALKNADFAFICSGTATLEAALIGTPFVLGYVAPKLDYVIGRLFLKLNFIGLANIFFNALNNEVAGLGESRLHEELIQNEMNKENLINSLNKLKDLDKRNEFLENCKKLRKYLKNGSAANVAKIVLS